MIPQILDITESNGEFFYLTSDQILVSSFEAELIDLDSSGSSSRFENLAFLLHQLPESLAIKFSFKAEPCFQSEHLHQRASALEEVGFVKQRLWIHFELTCGNIGRDLLKVFNAILKKDYDPHLYLESIKKIKELIPRELFLSAGFQLRPCTVEEIQSFFLPPNVPVIPAQSALSVGPEYIGLIKLYKLGNSELNLTSLASTRSDLPIPYSIISKVKKPNEAVFRERLNRKRSQEEKLKGLKAQEKAQANDEAIADADNRGDKFLNLEHHILISRSSEAELKKDISFIAQKLFRLGEYIVEPVLGCEPSLRATLPGGKSHLLERIFEKHNKIAAYLPISAFGTSPKAPQSKTALAYHRSDLSLDFLDPSDSRLANAMRNIFAKAGHGKSVLLNLSIKAIAENKSSSIYIVDVASSHTRTVEELGGTVYDIGMNSGTPINPFRILKSTSEPSIIAILKTCISELLDDEKDGQISIADSFYLDEALLSYADSHPTHPSIPDFIEFLFPKLDSEKTLFPKFPRKEHLLRFSKKGIYKNIFAPFTDTEIPRIQYFNIQKVSTATNAAVMKAIVASAIADFWIKVETKTKGDPLEFIIDEAPMVIERNFRSLTHQTTQTRKDNGRLTLVAQKIEQLAINGNTTLFSNADTNIFLGNDDKLELYREALSLTSSDIEQIRALHIKPGEYSQFYIKNPLTAHLGQIILSKAEYWGATTKPEERDLIEKIQKQLPNLEVHKIAKLIAANESARII